MGNSQTYHTENLKIEMLWQVKYRAYNSKKPIAMKYWLSTIKGGY